MYIKAFVLLICISIAAVSVMCGRRIPSGAGPFRVVIRKSTNLSDEITTTGKYWTTLFTTPYRTGQLQNIWGAAFNSIEFNDDSKVEVKMAAWKNHKWKKNAFAMTFDKGCSDLVRQAKSLMVLLYGEEGGRCPIKPGHRMIRNQTFNLVFPQFPVFPYGRWLQTLRLFKNSETYGIISTEVDTIPK